MDSGLNRLLTLQQTRNLASREAWESFAGHRRQVTELLRRARRDGSGRLCLLGAGNCNDLDLAVLRASYRLVALVDWDAAALQAGVARQAAPAETGESGQLELWGDVELTGIAEALATSTPAAPLADAELQACLDQAGSFRPAGPAGEFETVASLNLLSQLIEAVAAALGPDHASLIELVCAVRMRHLQLMLEMTEPGGTALLILDFVSSDTCPSLAATSPQELPQTLAAQILARNFFTGLNPAVLCQLLHGDPRLAPYVSSVVVTDPWLWSLGSRTFGVCGIVIERQNAGPIG